MDTIILWVEMWTYFFSCTANLFFANRDYERPRVLFLEERKSYLGFNGRVTDSVPPFDTTICISFLSY